MPKPMSDLAKQLEALLFYAAEPLSFKVLAEMTDANEAAVQKALDELAESLSGRSLVLIRDQKAASLVTGPESASLIEAFAKRDREAPLSNAATEVLSIIAYTGAAAKGDIDFIRGVNSQYTLRSLMMRGLIMRDGSEKGTATYRGTVELLSFLGIPSYNDLPKRDELLATYQGLLATRETAESAQ